MQAKREQNGSGQQEKEVADSDHGGQRIVSEQVPANTWQEILEYLKLFGYKLQIRESVLMKQMSSKKR
jgi:hypothetical protein